MNVQMKPLPYTPEMLAEVRESNLPKLLAIAEAVRKAMNK